MEEWREWVFAGIGAIIFLIGIIVRIKTSKNGKKCTETVSAEIVEIREHESWTENDKGKSRKEIYYHPVYHFVFRGKEYNVWSQYGSGRSGKFKLGNQEKIRYNPNNPREIYTKLARKADKQFSRFLMFVGLLFIVVNIIVMHGAL